MGAQPPKRSPQREAAILASLRAGNTRAAAAAFAEIGRRTFYLWLEDDAFREACEKAEADAETRFLEQVAKAAIDGTWQAAAWWLERRRSADYARHDKVDVNIDVRREAERIAATLDGVSAEQLIAEAERIVAEASREP